jgi:hypothetical protein
LNKADPRVDSDMDGSRRVGAGTTGTGSSSTGYSTSGAQNTTGTGIGSHSSAPGTTGTGVGHSTTHGSHDTTSSTHKPSLMDKLNPKVDSNGDGKAGFMK